tara:strand:- start:844 stop:1017 length:174 start_codon:yes stop_codon:yes gene_type:complete
MTHVSRGNPAFAYTTESLYAAPSRPIIDILRNVILRWSRVREIKVFPREIEEVPEIL